MNYQNRLRGCVFLACGAMTLSVVALGVTQNKSERPILYESSVQYDNGNLSGDDIEAQYPTIIAYDREGNEYIVEDYENYYIEQALLEQGYYRDDVPLSYEEQDYLHTACDEFGVDYALMLGLIEQETNFQNVVGDNGASEGYCQCQRRWWKDLMEEIDAEDLMNPYDNFRASCAILTYLYDKYENWIDTLTAYNTGSGGNSKYAASVLKNMENWQKMLDN